MVDIARDPRWGRISEGAGEDPYLGSAMARARVRGFQGQDPAAPDRVLACVKHWVAYGMRKEAETITPSTCRNRPYDPSTFPPFRAALEAGAGTVMTRSTRSTACPLRLIHSR